MENIFYFIDNDGVEQPAWKHEDGTLVSFWDCFNYLTIQDEDGFVREISRSEAMELGYM